jgi:RNA polymerase sigma-70 factor (ECF subfamily)
VEASTSGLAARIVSGEREAEAELVNLYWRRAFAMACQRLGDREAAQDVAQEVMMAVLLAARRGQIQQPDKLASFVYGVALNLIRNHRRAVFRRPETSLPEGLEMPAAPGPADDDFERRQVVREILDGLEPADRRIFELTLFDGLKPGEIAARLRASPEAIRARKSRALRRVMEALRGEAT